MPKANPLPSKEELEELFHYDEKTGALLKKTPMGLLPVTLQRERRGHQYVRIGGRNYGLHRVIKAMKGGVDNPYACVGHLDGDIRDNRHLNLFEMTESQMKRRRNGTKNPYITTVEKFIEYSSVSQRFIVRPTFADLQRRFRSYKTLEEARAARDVGISVLRQEVIDRESPLPFE